MRENKHEDCGREKKAVTGETELISKLARSVKCSSDKIPDCKEVAQLLSANVRSLVRGSKREELTILVNEHSIDIITR